MSTQSKDDRAIDQVTATCLARAKQLFARLALLFTASYGLLYFAYKFEIPWSGMNDFRHYYKMYLKPLDLHVAIAPFVLRQVSAVVTHLVWKCGIYYPNQIWFVDPAYDQRIFFAALFTNWVFLVLASAIAGLLAEEFLGRRNSLAALIAGFLCLLSFYSQYVVITGITEGLNWFLAALGFYAYVRGRNWLLAAVIVLATFQRETILIAFASIAALDMLRARTVIRRSAWVICLAAVCFAVYVGMRRMVPGHPAQTSVSLLLLSLRQQHFNRAMLFQGLMTQNVVAVAIVLRWATRRRTGMPLRWFPLALGTIGILECVALIAGLDNDFGRIGGILTPVFAAFAAVDLAQWDDDRVAHTVRPTVR